MVATGVNVYRGGETFDEQGLFNTPSNPVLFRGENGDILFTEMVVVFACMLEHGGFVFAESITGGGGVIVETG